MKKQLIILSVFLLLITGAVFPGEFDLGITVTPFSMIKSEDAASTEELYGLEEGSFLQDNSVGLHLGYSFWWLFYTSADFNLVPAWYVKESTSYTSDTGQYVDGVMAPGIVSYFDVGIRPTIGPIVLMAEMGINYLYVHSYYAEEDDTGGGTGVNMRLGAGLRYKSLLFTLVGTAFFSSVDQMTGTLQNIADGNQMAQDDFIASLVPSFLVAIRF